MEGALRFPERRGTPIDNNLAGRPSVSCQKQQLVPLWERESGNSRHLSQGDQHGKAPWVLGAGYC